MNPSLSDRALRRVVNIEPGEGRALGWAFAYFFFLLCAYYILRPLRDEMGVAAGVANLQWLFTEAHAALAGDKQDEQMAEPYVTELNRVLSA